MVNFTNENNRVGKVDGGKKELESAKIKEIIKSRSLRKSSEESITKSVQLPLPVKK